MSTAIDLGAVRRGFTRPALEAQRIYRRLLDAMSRPGSLQDLSEAPEPPAGFTRAMAGIALTLLDFETPVWLDPSLRGAEAEAWLRFHCNCPFVEDPRAAAFALVVDMATMPRLDAFDQGDARYPDRSTTIVMQIAALTGGAPVTLEGPGIDGSIGVAPTGLPTDFWPQVAENGREFQLGVDVMVVDAESVLGLPRTVRVAAARGADATD
ncbi:MAG: phosphonate C-P lyase system protein PhnH [Pseudomonadales bacterium]|jgi:alpha-D-ribose 1-methylphosphonate 5-triphosphate synthase subunit PhnH|nr:phosphonate C-P lyase system protein PhnH [Pseudomonadales bacterium]